MSAQGGNPFHPSEQISGNKRKGNKREMARTGKDKAGRDKRRKYLDRHFRLCLIRQKRLSEQSTGSVNSMYHGIFRLGCILRFNTDSYDRRLDTGRAVGMTTLCIEQCVLHNDTGGLTVYSRSDHLLALSLLGINLLQLFHEMSVKTTRKN